MSQTRWVALLLGILMLLALTATYLALHKTGAIGTILDGTALRERIEQLGTWGPLAIIAPMMLSILASPIPSAPIAMAAGAATGTPGARSTSWRGAETLKDAELFPLNHQRRL